MDHEDDRDDGFEKLTLQKMEVLTELNGLDVGGLSAIHPNFLATLENNTIRTVVLGQWKSERLLLSLFLRLNTGSVPLSPQELRQALIPGRFIAWLDDYSGSMLSLRRLLGNAHPDRRMVDAELVLRHLAFSMSPLPYTGNLKQFLDSTSKTLNSQWSDLQAQAADEIENLAEGLEALIDMFGLAACRKWSSGKYERALNRAIFDVQAYSFSYPEVREALRNSADELANGFQALCDRDQAFISSVTATTKTREAFLTRHRKWARLVREVSGVRYELPAPLQA